MNLGKFGVVNLRTSEASQQHVEREKVSVGKVDVDVSKELDVLQVWLYWLLTVAWETIRSWNYTVPLTTPNYLTS